ncbi:hypothetical protein J6397_29585 [Rhodococcus qingshengii]|uniref:hypothetical protein n=1 Tax=Rhodococcus qingshengii TaxID=334542 RepID=UPI001AEB0990|nr:hypothetical protein [Rhodococcus qingshengii]MBP1054303.1 hypothetical protein [Rhodococcus qingshengii]
MTTSPAIPARGSEEPWRSNDHWKAGDKAWWISLTGDGVSRTMVDIVDPAEGTVRDPRVTYNDGVFRLADRFESVRHREDSCTSCTDSVLELLAAGQDQETAYWGRWSPAAHDRFDALMETIQWRQADNFTLGTFTSAADVPAWFREATAGHLISADFPSLCLGRVWEPIDWPTLIAEHPGDLSVLVSDGWTREHLTWEMLVAAFRMIDAAGLTACFDATVEIDMDGALALLPAGIGSNGIGEHPDLVAGVTAALGGIEFGGWGGEFWILN